MGRLSEKLKGFIKKTPFYKPLKGGYQYYRRLGGVLTELRLAILQGLLPEGYFVQQTPFFNIYPNYYPTFQEESRTYHQGTRHKNTRDGNRLLSVKLLLDIASNCDTGDCAELGTYQGNFARIIWRHMSKISCLYCFDTFEGFDHSDLNLETRTTGIEVGVGLYSDTTEELVIRTIAGGRGDSRLILRKGYFPDTFRGLEDKKWRFVHLDCDLYEPMRKGLELFWPRIVSGGVLLIHDYNGGYIGVKKAVNEFFELLGIVPVPLCDQAGSVVVIKDRVE